MQSSRNASLAAKAAVFLAFFSLASCGDKRSGPTKPDSQPTTKEVAQEPVKPISKEAAEVARCKAVVETAKAKVTEREKTLTLATEEHGALTKAETALSDALAKDANLIKAKDALTAAEKALQEAKAKYLASQKHDDSKATTASEQRALLHEQAKLELLLNHPGSPVGEKLATDADLQAAKEALALASSHQSPPDPARAQAQAKVQQATSAEAAEAKAANEKLKAAEALLRTAVAEAQTALSLAREKAVAAAAEAKGMGAQAAAATAEKKALQAKANARHGALKLVERQLAESDPSLAEQRKGVADAEAKLAAISDAPVAAAAKALSEAMAKADECVKKIMDSNPRYKELDQLVKADQAKLAELQLQMLTQDSAPKAEDLTALQKRISTNNLEMKELRGKGGFTEFYATRANADKAWKAAVAASPEAQAANAAVIAAKKTLTDAAATLAASKYSQANAANAKDAVQLARLDYTLTLNRLELEGANSPISAKVFADAAVVAAQKNLAEKQAALSAGTEEILAARTNATEAEKKLRTATATASQTLGLPPLDAAASKAQEASKAKREAAQKVVTEKRTAALANIPEAILAQGRLAEIQTKLKAIADAQRSAEAKKAKDVEANMKANPEIAAAQSAITKEQEAVKAILTAEPYLSLIKAVSTARSALNNAVSKKLKSDSALIQFRKELAQAQADLQAAEKAEKGGSAEAAPKAEKPGTPAATPKAK